MLFPAGKIPTGTGFAPPKNATPITAAPYLVAKTDYAGNGGTVGFNEMAMLNREPPSS